MLRAATTWLIGAVWLSAVAGGFQVWERYDATPGPMGTSAAAADATAGGRWQLTVFAHPRCPCTRAALDEVAGFGTRPELLVRVLFVRPPDAPADWGRGESWERAARIPGAEVACDEGGAEARRLGAKTSGHAVLINPAGRAVFRGGLTSSRGRVGGGAGRHAVLNWVDGRQGAGAAPVFGCPLFTPEDSPLE